MNIYLIKSYIKTIKYTKLTVSRKLYTACKRETNFKTWILCISSQISRYLSSFYVSEKKGDVINYQNKRNIKSIERRKLC